MDRVSPYLRRIDETRIYSNFGPLTRSLEDRLALRFGLVPGSVAMVANATLALTLVLQAQGARPGTLCAMPAWTFIASAHAAVLAGLTPYFIDVAPDTWMLAPESMDETLAGAPAPVGAIMPIAPFGLPIDVAAWERYQARTGIPVVIDAAAAFDTLKPGSTPAVVSLHATKVLGIGEGGFAISKDTALIRDIRTRSNFGFAGTREATVPAINAKFSEYHAAIGHAALDDWSETRAEWMAVADAYRRAFADSNHVHFQSGFGKSWVTSTCVLQLECPAEQAGRALADAEIETRRWWGHGAHDHQATRSMPRSVLITTQALARSTIAVPFYRDLEDGIASRIADCLEAVQ